MKQFIKNLFKIKKQSNISNDMFYCEIESNPAHQKCKEQCNWCKKEFEKMSKKKIK